MRILILKDIDNNKAILLMGLLMLVCLSIFTNPSNALLMALIAGLLIVFIACGSLVYVESYEEKHRGFRFLATLPLNKYQVFGAKACFLGIIILVYTSIACVSFTISKTDLLPFQYALAVIIMAGNLSFILTGVMYVFISTSGHKRFNKGLKVAIPILSMAILMTFFLAKNNNLTVDYTALDSMIKGSTGYLITISIMVFFTLSMLTSALLKKEV